MKTITLPKNNETPTKGIKTVRTIKGVDLIDEYIGYTTYDNDEENILLIKFREDVEYKESGRWKCEKSPTGSHHFIVKGANGVCKHCGATQEYNIKRGYRADYYPKSRPKRHQGLH